MATAGAAAADDDVVMGHTCRRQGRLPQAARLGREVAERARFGSNLPKVNCVVKKAGSRRAHTPANGAQAYEEAVDGNCGYHALHKGLRATLGLTNTHLPQDYAGLKSALAGSIIAHCLGPAASAADTTTLLSDAQFHRTRALWCTVVKDMATRTVEKAEPRDRGVMTYGWLVERADEKVQREWLDVC